MIIYTHTYYNDVTTIKKRVVLTINRTKALWIIFVNLKRKIKIINKTSVDDSGL